jgi:hypothetical protein
VDVSEVVAKRGHAPSRDVLADEVADQEAEQCVALDRHECDRRLGVFVERVESLLGERVDGAFAGLAGFLAGREVAELRDSLRLGDEGRRCGLMTLRAQGRRT